eukprot:TRINITY_DN8612_c0_g1_i7.p1 TRINITY_DN8612_c0_g1~~TRINITY_DN8612_c0_g1_i7.p1  ORF type:complete len:372 (-),score=43.02 TRINITY_DN8612_c0_g1_i7:878-1993(-)
MITDLTQIKPMQLYIFFLLSIFAMVFLYGYRIAARVKYRGIPGPPPFWLFGNLPQFTHLANDVSKWAEMYGPVYKMFLGGRAVIVVSDPQFAQKVFLKSQVRPNVFAPPNAGPRGKYEKEVLFFTSGHRFRTLKSAFQVAFNQGSIHNYFPLMKRHASRLCDDISNKMENNEAFNIYEKLQNMTLEVVGTTAFGIDFALLDNSQSQCAENDYGIIPQKMLDSVKVLLKGIMNNGKESLSPWVVINYLFPELRKLWAELAYRFPVAEFEKEVEKAALEFFSQCQNITRHEREKFSQQSNDTTTNKKNIIDPGCFLAKIIQTKDFYNNGQPLTDIQVLVGVVIYSLVDKSLMIMLFNGTIIKGCNNNNNQQQC